MNFKKNNQIGIANILFPIWERLSDEQGMEFLNQIWELRNMPSEDGRFNNAYDDIFQHTVNNFDWPTEYLFAERLKLYEDTDKFKAFVEGLLLPKWYNDENELTLISDKINSLLKDDKLKLVIDDYSDTGLPIQKIYLSEEVFNLPEGIKKNNIPFYVKEGGVIDYQEKEYFVLEPNTGWNDYSVVSIFDLVYYNQSKGNLNIGSVKIIHRNELITWTLLPKKFYQLSEDFCSLSGYEAYYFRLNDVFGEKGMISLLFALQDTAYFTDIHDNYEKTYNFKSSLIRSDKAERILREIKPKLQGKNLEDLYSFQYKFKPNYSDEYIEIPFDFNNKKPLPNRIFSIIGKNGTGKTQLLTSLPSNFEKNNQENFLNKIPNFSKIIAVSYSVFDTFNIPKKNVTFNYVYCGLRNEDGDIRSKRALVLGFHANWKKIMQLERVGKWRSILLNFLDREIINAFIIGNEVSLEGFHFIKDRLSSGQSILLFIITEVVANIRLDTLLLYDEPETHLHPNAIVQLMNTIYELVNEFESYCLIATHSPLVIRELFSKNVFVMQRDNNVASIKRIGLECFGENLGVLTDEVFGDREVPKQYKKIITELIKSGKTFDEIVQMLEFDEYPLSLNARIFIKNLLKNEEF